MIMLQKILTKIPHWDILSSVHTRTKTINHSTFYSFFSFPYIVPLLYPIEAIREIFIEFMDDKKSDRNIISLFITAKSQNNW